MTRGPWVLPDLCDAYGDAVEVLELELRSFGGRDDFAGPVRTVRCFEDNSRVAELVATPGDGAVLVVDGGGSRRCALLGDNLAEKAAAHGWAGVLVFGCVRDVAALEGIDLGVQALGAHPRRSVKRGAGDVDVPVRFGGVQFAPGRFVCADRNGVLVADEALHMPDDA
jgi:regulator of ribonuclease activity A